MIIQIILIFIPLLLGFFYPIQNLFYVIIDFYGNSTVIKSFISSLVDKEYYISIICGTLLTIIIRRVIIKFNKDKYFNKGNKYSSFPYWIYWIAAKFLRFGKITLVRIPIYLQFKLVLKDTFPIIETDSSFVNEEHSIKEKTVETKKKRMNVIHNELNLVLIDTYDIKKDEIPVNKIDLPTIIIKSGNQKDGDRSMNPNFTKEVRIQTDYFRKQYDKVNIFATTNTNHTKLIIENCFKNAERTGFKEVFVYQANRKNYKFEDKYAVV